MNQFYLDYKSLFLTIRKTWAIILKFFFTPLDFLNFLAKESLNFSENQSFVSKNLFCLYHIVLLTHHIKDYISLKKYASI